MPSFASYHDQALFHLRLWHLDKSQLYGRAWQIRTSPTTERHEVAGKNKASEASF